MVAVISVAVTALILIFLMAGVVGVLDTLRTSTWRQVAAERRQNWETRRLQQLRHPSLG